MRRLASSTESPVGNSIARSDDIGVGGKVFGCVEIMELLPAIGEINFDGFDRILPLPYALPCECRGSRSFGQIVPIQREKRLATFAVVRDDGIRLSLGHRVKQSRV